MKLASNIFEFVLVVATLGFVCGVSVIILEPRVETISYLWQYGHTPAFAALIVLGICGAIIRRSRQSYVNYVRASFLLVGGVVGALGLVTVCIGLLLGFANEEIVNALAVSGVCFVLVGIALTTKRLTGVSCKNEFQSLITA